MRSKTSCRFRPLGIFACLAFALTLSSAFADDAKPSADKQAAADIEAGGDEKKEMVWHSDPTCQFVFFAILEGLYTDGVPEEVVNLVIPEDVGLEHSFVFRCELCHAAYEAFALYQKRSAFAGGDGKTTFGKGKKDFTEVITDLKNEDTLTRLRAMGGMVRGWIDGRMDTLRLSKEEREELLTEMTQFAKAGNSQFRKLRSNPKTVYFEWQFYDGCQACKAAEILSKKEGIRR